MAITIQHSPSARALSDTSRLAGALRTLDLLRQQNEQREFDRERQQRQIDAQRDAQLRDIDARREAQLRGIDAQQESQMIGLQGQEIFNEQNRDFQGQQAAFDRSQRGALAEFQAYQNQLNRQANLDSQSIAQEGRLDAIEAQGAISEQLQGQRFAHLDAQQQSEIQRAFENAKFDADARVDLTRLQRDYANLDRALAKGHINQAQYEMARAQIEDEMARIGGRPVQPPPKAEERIEWIEHGGQEYPVIINDDGTPQVMRGWSPPQNNTADLEKEQRAAEAKQDAEDMKFRRELIRENERRKSNPTNIAPILSDEEIEDLVRRSRGPSEPEETRLYEFEEPEAAVTMEQPDPNSLVGEAVVIQQYEAMPEEQRTAFNSRLVEIAGQVAQAQDPASLHLLREALIEALAEAGFRPEDWPVLKQQIGL